MLHPKQHQYRVKAGDTLAKISQHQYGNAGLWPEIARANRIPNGNLILIGMNLALPVIHAAPPGAAVQHRAQAPGLRPPSGRPPIGSAAQPQLSPAAFIPNLPLARAVMFPAVKYNLSTVHPVTVPTPQADFKVTLSGEITVQEKGVLTDLEISQGGLTQKLKAEYASKFFNLAGNIQVKWSPASPQAEVSCGFTVATKINGKEFVTHEYQIIPPNKIKYTLKPKEISGEALGMVFKGTLGYELEITVKNNISSSVPMRVPVSAPDRTMVWITAGGLAAVGAAIIVGDILKDFGTAGIGTLESPLSWATAMTMFSRAAAMAH